MKAALICMQLALASILAQAQSNPVPFMSQPLVPDATVPGGASFTLTVNGSGFVSGATVHWNATALSTTFVSSSQLTAVVPAPEIATAGTASVTVTNPAPGGGTSNVQFFSVSKPNAPPSFAPAVEYLSGGGGPASVAVADVNGDGKLDLVVANECPATCTFLPTAGTIGVLLGNGDGTFAPPVAYASGGYLADSVVVADVNGDGKPDLLVANTCSDSACLEYGTIGVLLGNGDGTFQAAMTFEAGGGFAASLAVADVNGDGKLDVVVASGENATVMLGKGDGTFPTFVNYYANGTSTTSIAVADVNGDGKLDLVVVMLCAASSCTQYGPITVLLGNGDGTFHLGASFGLGYFLTIADVNLDGKPDLLVADFFNSSASVYLGNGDGTFQGPMLNFPGGYSPNSIAVADVSVDGELDLVVANQSTSPLCSQQSTTGVILGNGDGTFQNAVSFASYSTFATAVAAADLNGDGRPDLVVAYLDRDCFNSPYRGYISVLINNATVTLSPTSLNFGTQTAGTTSAPKVVVLTNTGTQPLILASVGISGTNTNDFAQTNNCPNSIAPDAGCNISVTFTPTGGGNRTAAVSIADSALGSPQNLPLSGNVPDFSVTANSPTSQTVTPGQAANFVVTVTPLDGFAETVSLTCSGTPPQATCAVTPSSVILNGSSGAAVNVAVGTAGMSTGLMRPPRLPIDMRWALGLALSPVAGMMVLSGMGSVRRHRQLFRRVTLLVIFPAFLTWTSCGGGDSGRNGGTPVGTYNVTVTGAYTSNLVTLSHATQLTLVVQ